ncbi:MAG TPA: DUF86 domain-containing protein [Acetobacteraceae bacterium]|nr:DUF86 domain-containing protein [Acetobacteraceae bacterium]
MTSEAVAKLLWDARQATDRIARIAGGKRFEDYLSDEVLRWAVERQFIVIGEALSALRRIDPTVAAGIPDLARIIAFRNVLIHGYAGVDDRLVWGVIERDLSVLGASLARLLGTGA